MQNNDQTKRLMDLMPGPGMEGMGSVMLRLAEMAAAQHRAQLAPREVEPWRGLTESDHLDQDSTQDKAGQGSPVSARIARLGGPATTEGC